MNDLNVWGQREMTNTKPSSSRRADQLALETKGVGWDLWKDATLWVGEATRLIQPRVPEGQRWTSYTASDRFSLEQKYKMKVEWVRATVGRGFLSEEDERI